MASERDNDDNSRTLDLLVGMDLERAKAVCRSRTGLLGTVPHASQESGRLLHSCQSLACGCKDRARRYVDLVPVVLPSEDGFGCTRDVCAENAGRCSTVETEQLGADAAAQKMRVLRYNHVETP